MDKERKALMSRDIRTAEDFRKFVDDSAKLRDKNIRRIDRQHHFIVFCLVTVVLIITSWSIYNAVGQ